MKERPILFSTPMVQAILNGTKSVTRRIIKPQPDENGISFMKNAPLNWESHYKEEWKPYFFDDDNGERHAIHCPYGEAGDILWVRETWMEDDVGYFYKANFDESDINHLKGNWKPTIHMPKVAARIFLQVVSVRVERVNKITQEDAEAEGVLIDDDGLACMNYLNNEFEMFPPEQSFETLWSKINGEPSPIQKKINGKTKTVAYICYPFDEESAMKFEGRTHWRGQPLTVIPNPWVWVVEFKRIERL